MTAASHATAHSSEPAQPSPEASQARVPLVVDVDGTLIKTNLLVESVLQWVARRPFDIWRLPFWLARGKAALKAGLVDHIGDPGIADIPLREETVETIRAAQRADRPVYLASASDRRLVEKLAERVGGIAGVFGSDGGVNLAGTAKSDCLVAEFGHRGFDYLGDARIDFAVWRTARKVLALTHDAAFETKLVATFPHAEIVARPRPRAQDYVKALRPHQWAKNALIFLPLFAGHFFGLEHILAAVLAFVSFSLVASSAYVINDLLDLPADREHPRKRMRPFAAGNVPLHHGIALAPLLLTAAFAVALLLPPRFAMVVIIYFGTTLAYSVLLKRKIVLDVVTLGGLYTLRVVAGVAAIGATYSQWLLMFCLFLFMGLAIAKRCSELVAGERDGKAVAVGRGYRVDDLRVLLAFGAAAGYTAVLVVTLYLSSAEVRQLYQFPDRLWLLCPILLYWITTMLMIANRGELHDDPVVFALTDRMSWGSAVGVVGVILISM